MKLEKIQFGEKPFRKLRNITIEIAPRITVIAGHNGIGKSTILGLIANCSGLSRGEKSLFGTTYQSNFQEAFYLDYFADYDKYIQETTSTPKKNIPKVTLEYSNDDGSKLQKSCSVSLQKKTISTMQYKSHMIKVPKESKIREKNTQECAMETVALFHESIATPTKKENNHQIDVWRLRIIPRTLAKSPSTDIDNEPSDEFYLSELSTTKTNSSESGKIPIPTLYLGMSRMAPIGEFEDDQIEKRKAIKFNEQDKDFIHESFNHVLSFNKGAEDHLVLHSFAKSRKKSYLPTFDNHDTFAISLGQDSLSSIITALASFNQLKREQSENYKGGILVIDEVDAGFHPRAQEKLIDLLSKKARELNLQVVITTHSLTVIKKILSENDRPGNKVNNVIYLQDTRFPRAMENPTYTKIKYDMLGLVSPSTDKNIIKIYLEDDEAKFFLERLLSSKSISNHEASFGTDIELIPLSVGSNILMNLCAGDSYFKQVVIIPDNDVSTEQKNRKLIEDNKNICPLPGNDAFNENTPPQERTPEAIIYNYLKSKTDFNLSENAAFWYNINKDYTTDYVIDRVLTIDLSTTNDKKHREIMKAWFNHNRDFIGQARIVESWCSENSTSTDTFISELTTAIDTATRCSVKR
ncbi:AAA family ATPase [Chitinibacter sp. FCG-7]|uniref:AAA family ATPase n=1 Tax=Chitinibacter mangrovi TaxID=3153927 RepID=A0AAU7F7H1_9NEIS